MYPILLNLGPLVISSFGLFLALALLAGSFIVWRLINVYEIDQEKTLDLIFLTFFGGLIGSRLLFVVLNYQQFHDTLRIVLINRYPGLNFWGGLFLSLLILGFFAARLKVNFWLIADIAAVGLMVALSLGSIGCLLAGCQYGISSNLPIALSQVGLIGKRFPVQIIDMLAYFMLFLYLWRVCLRFHFAGKVFALGLIYFALISFLTEFLRGDKQILYASLSLGHLLSFSLFLMGVVVYYRQGKKSFIKDLRFIFGVFTNSKLRSIVLLKFEKSWYNLKVNFNVWTKTRIKKLFRRLNVKSNPPEF